jgi:small subunit ribosomal protein S11
MKKNNNPNKQKVNLGPKTVPNNEAIINVAATINNTIVSIFDINNNLLAKSSAGLLNYKGAKKGLAPVARQVIIACLEKVIKEYGVQTVKLKMKYIGAGRAAVLNVLSSKDIPITISEIVDVTPTAHNGCRPRKRPKK